MSPETFWPAITGIVPASYHHNCFGQLSLEFLTPESLVDEAAQLFFFGSVCMVTLKAGMAPAEDARPSHAAGGG